MSNDTCKKLRRGDIWFFDMDKTNVEGNRAKLNKIRPCLVVSNDKFNESGFFKPFIIPFTTQMHSEGNQGMKVLDSTVTSYPDFTTMQSIPKEFSKSYKGSLTDSKLREIDETLVSVLGLDYLFEEKDKEIELLKQEIEQLKSTQVVVDNIISEKDSIDLLTKENNQLKQKLEETNNKLAYRDRQLRKFSSFGGQEVAVTKTDFNKSSEFRRVTITSPSTANVNIAKDYVDKVQSRYQKPAENPKPVVPAKEADTKIPIKYVGIKEARVWSRKMKEEFLEFAKERPVKDVVIKFKIKSVGTYYNILKICNDRVNDVIVVKPSLYEGITVTPKSVNESWSIDECNKYLDDVKNCTIKEARAKYNIKSDYSYYSIIDVCTAKIKNK